MQHKGEPNAQTLDIYEVSTQLRSLFARRRCARATPHNKTNAYKAVWGPRGVAPNPVRDYVAAEGRARARRHSKPCLLPGGIVRSRKGEASQQTLPVTIWKRKAAQGRYGATNPSPSQGHARARRRKKPCRLLCSTARPRKGEASQQTLPLGKAAQGRGAATNPDSYYVVSQGRARARRRNKP